MRKLIASSLLAASLILGVGVPSAHAIPAPIYAITTDGILFYTYRWDWWARCWVLIRVDMTYPGGD